MFWQFTFKAKLVSFIFVYNFFTRLLFVLGGIYLYLARISLLRLILFIFYRVVFFLFKALFIELVINFNSGGD
jgi:hypothetical protein